MEGKLTGPQLFALKEARNHSGLFRTGAKYRGTQGGYEIRKATIEALLAKGMLKAQRADRFILTSRGQLYAGGKAAAQ